MYSRVTQIRHSPKEMWSSMKKPERDPESYRLWPWLSFISLACIVLFPAKSQLALLNSPLNEYDILDRAFSGDIFLKTTTVLVLGSLVLVKSSSFKSWSRFIWHTIVAPNGQDDHQTGIDKVLLNSTFLNGTS